MKQNKKTVKKAAKKTIDSVSAIPIREQDLFINRHPDGSITAFRLDHDQFYNIDGIAAEFLMLVNGNRTVTEIKEKLRRKHNPPTRFDQDISRFLKDLKKNGLIRSSMSKG